MVQPRVARGVSVLQSKKVRVLTAFAAVTCLLWIFGLGWAIKDYLVGTEKSIAAPSVSDEPIAASQLKIIALGDSLTRGTGDSEGKGYAGYVNDQLKEAGMDVSFINLGIKGLTSEELAKQIKEKEIKRQIGGADIILITIGGNDLFLGGQTLSDISEESTNKLEDAFVIHLKEIAESIRAVNTEATVYLLGLYDPFNAFSDGMLTSSAVRSWNNKTMDVLADYSKMVFVPTYDLFQLNVDDYLFTDHFHPNEIGYRRMADRVAGLISSGGVKE